MNNEVRRFLIDRARQRTSQPVYYQQLSDACALKLSMADITHRNEMAVILGDISRYENGHGRPLLSSMVIRSGDHLEGDGFYKLADELGFGDWKRLKREGIFEVEQIRKCIDFWQDAANYPRWY
jgi:hypothetical protein